MSLSKQQWMHYVFTYYMLFDLWLLFQCNDKHWEVQFAVFLFFFFAVGISYRVQRVGVIFWFLCANITKSSRHEGEVQRADFYE